MWLLVLAVGCGSDPAFDLRGSSTEPCDATVSGAELAQPGASCVVGADCVAFCCDCTAEGPSQTAGLCLDDGTCADEVAVCARLEEDELLCYNPAAREQR